MPNTKVIDKLNLPNGLTYELRDNTARVLIESLTVLSMLVSSTAADTPNITEIPTSATTTETGTLTPELAEPNCMYLVPTTFGGSVYAQFMSIGNAGAKRWISLGTTAVDMTGYLKVGKNSLNGNVIIPNITSSAPVETTFVDVEHDHTLTETPMTVGFSKDGFEQNAEVTLTQYTPTTDTEMVKGDWTTLGEDNVDVNVVKYGYTNHTLTITNDKTLNISKAPAVNGMSDNQTTQEVSFKAPQKLEIWNGLAGDDSNVVDGTGVVVIKPNATVVEKSTTGLNLNHTHTVAGNTYALSGEVVETP